MKWAAWLLAGVLGVSTLAASAVIVLNVRGEESLPSAPTELRATTQQIERGRYLATVGNCAGCHTTPGGEPYAGGVAVDTPYGVVFSSNITPHKQYGLGDWSSASFWRALHHGRSKSGRLLYPAFPYPSFSRVTREDSDALFAFLQAAVPESSQPNTAHRLRFPYGTQAALAMWRASSFRADDTPPLRADKSEEWNRGAYLVDGLGHCIACHGVRDRLGAIDKRFGMSGGSIKIDKWYAPSLTSAAEAGLSEWEIAEIVQLFRTGRTDQHSVAGPMADVISRSTQHWSDSDLQAMAAYLKDLPMPARGRTSPSIVKPSTRRDAASADRGQKTYDQRCAYCHGSVGEGKPGKYPPLAGNRSVLMASPTNLIQIVRRGEFQPATAGNPRPLGMPPFAQVLDDEGIIDVLTFIRGAWGNDASAVTATDMFER